MSGYFADEHFEVVDQDRSMWLIKASLDLLGLTRVPVENVAARLAREHSAEIAVLYWFPEAPMDNTPYFGVRL